MKNKQVATYAIISTIVYGIAYANGGAENYAGDFTKFMYYLGVVGIYTFVIWGWVRLFKSDK